MIPRRVTTLVLTFLAVCAAGCATAPETQESEKPGTPAKAVAGAPSAPATPEAPSAASHPTKTTTGGNVSPESRSAEPVPAVRDEPPDAPRPAQPAPSPKAASMPPPEEPVAPAPVPAATPVVDPGGPIEVAATKSGLTRVGPEKCKVCHKVQFQSWSESAHAARTPPLDCESCHGPGSEYKGLAIMKDPEKARQAGLVNPDREFCMSCHTTWTDELLPRAHAHT